MESSGKTDGTGIKGISVPFLLWVQGYRKQADRKICLKSIYKTSKLCYSVDEADSRSRYKQMEKIEHKLFSFVSKDWRGKPLISLDVVVNLISATKTMTGLSVKCVVDRNEYQKGIKISDNKAAFLA